MANNTQKKEFKQNPDFPKVGAMLQKKELGQDGKPQYYLKIDENVEVTVNGKKVTALNIERPTAKYERMLSSGKISAEDYEQKMELYEDGELNFVKFEFSADLRPPKK